MTDAVLTIESGGKGVTGLTLNRPERRNALDAALRGALTDTFAELADDDECRAVVLTGAGGCFCAGFDLDELRAAVSVDELFAEADRYHRAVHAFAKPIVVAIAGPAVAGGLDLALMGDIRIAAPDATFGQPQVKAGVPAAYDLLRSVVAEPVARELCLTGRVVDADEARRVGLVHRVVDPPCLDHALALAASVAAAPAATAMKQQFVASQPNLFDGA
ncbi:MAG: enoyl-CoA hydratase/isomerase family protein [Acidimicrobiales bacterium]